MQLSWPFGSNSSALDIEYLKNKLTSEWVRLSSEREELRQIKFRSNIIIVGKIPFRPPSIYSHVGTTF